MHVKVDAILNISAVEKKDNRPTPTSQECEKENARHHMKRNNTNDEQYNKLSPNKEDIRQTSTRCKDGIFITFESH